MPSDKFPGENIIQKKEITLQDILTGQIPNWVSIAKETNLGSGLISNWDDNAPNKRGPKSPNRQMLLQKNDQVQITKDGPGFVTFQVDREDGVTVFFHVPSTQLKDTKIPIE